jgi:hypothetical protein
MFLIILTWWISVAFMLFICLIIKHEDYPVKFNDSWYEYINECKHDENFKNDHTSVIYSNSDEDNYIIDYNSDEDNCEDMIDYNSDEDMSYFNLYEDILIDYNSDMSYFNSDEDNPEDMIDYNSDEDNPEDMIDYNSDEDNPEDTIPLFPPLLIRSNCNQYLHKPLAT